MVNDYLVEVIVYPIYFVKKIFQSPRFLQKIMSDAWLHDLVAGGQALKNRGNRKNAGSSTMSMMVDLAFLSDQVEARTDTNVCPTAHLRIKSETGQCRPV